jgi:hypothetical protein
MSDISSVTVVAIQGHNVSSSAPADGNNLTWHSGASEWQPTAPPAPALESWVGTPNSQSQTIRKIPFVLSMTGLAPGQGSVQGSILSFTVASGKAFSLEYSAVSRFASSPTGCLGQQHIFAGYNNSGTVSIPSSGGYGPSGDGSQVGSSLANVDPYLDVSGSTVTLKCSANPGNGVVVDLQGYVTLMII